MTGIEVELATVGPDFAVVHATSAPDLVLQTTVGPVVVETTGPHHVVRVDGLEPNTEYSLSVDGVEDPYAPSLFRTLREPGGALLARVVTVNDVHFGEVVCGLWDADPTMGPVFRSEPGDPPYPEVMNAAAIDAVASVAPDAVVVKGDLTTSSADVDVERFHEVWGGAFGDRLVYVRGNHDATLPGGVQAHTVSGVTLALLDTTIPGKPFGQFPPDQLAWLGAVARQASGPVFVFGHHPPYSEDFDAGRAEPFCSTEDDARALYATLDAHDAIAGYFCGHTHRNRVRHTPGRSVPIVEVASVKEYPGVWAEYRVYERGYQQIVQRVTERSALDWAAKTRHMFHGIYRDYSLGQLDDRCFTRVF